MKAPFVIISIMIASVSFVDSDECEQYKRYYSTYYYYIRYIKCTGVNIMDPPDWFLDGYLEDLSFYKSDIPKLSKNIISRFGKLYTFTINGSFVNTIEAEAFNSSNDLIELNLPYNNLTILSTDTFMNTRSLIILDLSHNNIQNISKDLFRNNYALEHLNLSDNALTSLEIDNFNGLTSLLYLNLSGNTIRKVPNAHFGHQSKLITLDLSRNRIKYLDIHSFIGLESLLTLDISRNIIQSLQENVFYNVHQLSILDISENLIEYINAKELTETTNLTQISLHSNKMRCVVLMGIIKIFKAWNVIVTYGPERKQMSILGIRCNDTQDIVTENNETKPLDALEDLQKSEFYKFISILNSSNGMKSLDSPDEFFTKGFKNTDLYKYFNTFNGTSNRVDTDYVKRIVTDIMEMNDTHVVVDYTQHMELMGQLSSLQMWFGSLIIILLIMTASAWIYIYFNRNVNGGKRKDSELLEESIV